MGVAVVGLGYGERHVAAFQACPGVDVLAVCSRRREAAEAIGAARGVAVRTTDVAEALGAAGVDAVAIATPPALHHPIALAAAERGQHVLCEKPLALTSAQAAEMLTAATRAGIVHAVNFDFRTIPNVAEFHRLVRDGFLGELLHATVHWIGGAFADSTTAWTWRHSRAAAGLGVLGDLNHAIDDVIWHFGPIARVTANLQTLVPRRRDAAGRTRRCDAEDLAAFIAITMDGRQVTGQLSRCAHHGDRRHIECFGTDGVLSLLMPDTRSRAGSRLLGARAGDGRIVDLSVPDSAGMRDATQARFVEATRTASAEVVASFEDGVAAMRLSEALAKSSRSGAWVEIA